MTTDRPIIFSAAMVRAILAGEKTQTRRIVKPQPIGNADVQFRLAASVTLEGGKQLRCPYAGKRGEALPRLWVRETCRAHELDSGLDGVLYLADNAFIPIENTEEASERWVELATYGMTKSGRVERRIVPSIHMPRWASRIAIEIVGIRVERLNDISEEDALAEGSRAWSAEQATPVRDIPQEETRLIYRQLWESINGHDSWDDNPWVWVIEFRRVRLIE